jgi:hypothetical protein
MGEDNNLSHRLRNCKLDASTIGEHDIVEQVNHAVVAESGQFCVTASSSFFG